MEYMEDHLEEWLGEALEGYGEEDYLVFDCPGEWGDGGLTAWVGGTIVFGPPRGDDRVRVGTALVSPGAALLCKADTSLCIILIPPPSLPGMWWFPASSLICVYSPARPD
jgi:hypothetical protein